MTPATFIAKWRASELKERSGSQEHFIDLCRLLGEPTPAEADPSGERYCFERGARKDTGARGWADVWKRHCFAWEYKGKHADLDAAFDQLRQYALALENPPLLVVCDMARFRIRTNWTKQRERVARVRAGGPGRGFGPGEIEVGQGRAHRCGHPPGSWGFLFRERSVRQNAGMRIGSDRRGLARPAPARESRQSLVRTAGIARAIRRTAACCSWEILCWKRSGTRADVENFAGVYWIERLMVGGEW